MAIVIDINTLSSVFQSTCSDHNEFSPIMEWIKRDSGRMVIGGTKYKDELRLCHRSLKVIIELKSKRRVVAISDDAVDRRELELSEKISHRDCDDKHIIALLGVSHCRLFCSKDKRSFRFIKCRDLYPKGAPRVKIYSSRKHEKLLEVPVDFSKLRNVVA